jgi:heptosyltransferase-1
LKVLVVKLSALGDILHAMPAVRRVVSAGIEVDWMVDTRYADVLKLFPGLGAVHVVDPKGWGKAARSGNIPATFGKMKKQLSGPRSATYHMALDIQGLLKSAVLARLSGAGKVAGFSRSASREKAAASLYHLTVDVDPLSPVTSQISRLFSKSLQIPEGIEPPGLVVPDAGREAARPFLGMGSPAVLLAGGGWTTKLIPVDTMRQIARELCVNGPVLICSGSEEERERAGGAADGLDGVTVLDREPLETVAGVMEEARVVIGPDTGLVHLAAGLNTPTVSLFGPSLASRSGPDGEHHRWLQADVHCTPCFKRECDEFICMDSLDPAVVMRAVREVMR